MRNDAAKEKHLVIYDGNCGFCIAAIEALEKLDWLGRLSYVNFRAASFARQKEKLPRLESEILLVSPSGKQSWGFFAFRKISTLLPPLWVVSPLFYIPFSAAIGTKAYAYISKRRFHIGCKACMVKNETRKSWSRN